MESESNQEIYPDFCDLNSMHLIIFEEANKISDRHEKLLEKNSIGLIAWCHGSLCVHSVPSYWAHFGSFYTE